MNKKLNLSRLLNIALLCSIISLMSSAQTTNFGMMTVRPNDINGRLTAANNLGVNYVRETQLLSKWNGTNNTYIDFWLVHSKKAVLNINNDSTPSPFPKNLTAYESKLRSVLDVYGSKVELVVIENEELNDYDPLSSNTNLYHFGSLQDYINELTVAVNVCNQKGVQVTNGGFTTPLVASLKHYYDISGKQDSAMWLVQQMEGVSDDPLLWKRTDSLLNAYKNLSLTYVNLHWYEPLKNMTRATGVLRVLCNYLTQQTGKKVITNETGVKSSDSAFVTPLMKQWDVENVKYSIFFDGSGGFGAMPFTSASGVLLPTGIAFRNYIAGVPKSCPQSISITPSGLVYVCQGSSATLTASTGFINYLWSNGAVGRSISVNNSGNYSVISTLANCTAFSSNTVALLVNPLPAKPIVTATTLTPICANKNVKLTSSAGKTYLWNTGETTKIITVTAAGGYKVTITDDNGCPATSTSTQVIILPCIAPVNLRVTNITTTKATLNWDTASCATGYQFQYRKKGTTAWTTVSINGGAVSFRNLFNLTSATTYQWNILTTCKSTPDLLQSNYAAGAEFTTAGQ